MASQPIRYVNIIPAAKIKKEKIDDDEISIQCRLCGKGYCNKVALGNHVRMEHMEAYATGDPSVWTLIDEEAEKQKQKLEERKLIRKRTEDLISSMAPTSLMTLASEDVSYVIIKAEDAPVGKKRKKEEGEKSAKAEKAEKVVAKKDKEPQPITGPFECLQPVSPSNMGADGVCHQIFFSCCEYSIHHRDEHTRRRKGLRCQVCEKPLSTTGEDPQTPYNCDVCGVGCQTSKELAEHTSTAHVKLKPFECSICRKRFTQQGGVQQHMRMHTGDRPFPCTFCNKSFTQKSGLDQHLRIHTKVKPYRCVICGKTFCQSIHLKQHMRTHTQVSPFQCGICQKRFKQSSHLNYHLKNHNPANMSEEQKKKYLELVGMIGNAEVVEVEIDQSQSELQLEQVNEDYAIDTEQTWTVQLVES